MNKLAIKEKTNTSHWSSTENSSVYAWTQIYTIGNQYDDLKTIRYWVQAVRRVKKLTCNAS